MDTKSKIIEEFFSTLMKSERFFERIVGLSQNDKAATFLQGHAFTFLRVHPKSTVGDLADELNMSSSSAAQFTERLVSDNLIVRENDENDRRIVKLSLTEKGIELDDKMKASCLKKVNEIFKDITEEEFKELLRLHAKLLKTLKKQSDLL
jgi:MarR family transcriptional regulator, organic hydroperoxide resistance regulator